MTTVGEALNRRSDLQKRVAQLEERLRTSVLIQEDEQPPEEPEELLSELDAHCTELQRLIATINHTNASSRLPTGETVTEALARRDVLALRAAALRTVIRTATDRGLFGRSEIRMVRQMPELELLRRLHPAVARPGRCAARIEFEPFDEAEATAWPAARALPAEGGGALTLAHLFAYVHGYEMEPEPERAVGFGA
jgi:hypothetical protein